MGSDAPRRRLVIASPLPPERNGIADYCADLLPGLQAARDCTVVVADGQWDCTVPDGVRLLQRREYLSRRGQYDGVPHLYHVGNNPGHVYMLDLLAQTPGLIVLHDPGLHHLLDSATLAQGDEAGYAAALVAEYGWAGQVLADQFRQWGLREDRMMGDLPMLRGVLGPARGVIVHSRNAADTVALHAPGVPVSVINHHVTLPDAVEDAETIRTRFGIAAGELLIVSLGFVTRAKQIDLALRALADIAPSLPPFRYLVAGAAAAGELDVPGLARGLGIGDRVTVAGYVSAADMAGLLATADLLVNLRYPTSGESSGTLMRALARGVCTIVTDVGSFQNLPEGSVLRLPWSQRARHDLGRLLHAAGTDAMLRRQVGDRAAAWCRDECSIADGVAGYLAAIEAMEHRAAIAWSTSTLAWETRPLAMLAQEAGPGQPLWHDAGVLPTPVGACRVLAVLDDPGEAALLASRLGRSADEIATVPPTAAAWPALGDGAGLRGHDLALVCGTAALLPAEASVLLNRINQLLGFGGILVLEVHGDDPGDGGADHIMLHEQAGRDAFTQAGYAVEATVTSSPPEFGAIMPVATRRRCWRAVKLSEFNRPRSNLPVMARAE